MLDILLSLEFRIAKWRLKISFRGKVDFKVV